MIKSEDLRGKVVDTYKGIDIYLDKGCYYLDYNGDRYAQQGNDDMLRYAHTTIDVILLREQNALSRLS